MACDWKNMSCSNQIYLQDQVKWPTPRARDGQPEGLQSGMDRMGKYATCSLPTAVALWPTPTVCGNYNRKGASANSGDGLATAVAKYATPQAMDYRTGQISRWKDPARTQNLNDQVGGQLNPTWVEWLMGWPIGWTDLKPSATAKSPCKPPALGACWNSDMNKPLRVKTLAPSAQ